ncbi:hypothetical protein SS50377_20339 [Spironucleus salmonicida]|uniref:Uncharacterized protein n=1 Tax=Spironucleus salmonicida TaxID=348837 RepID=V6LER5_9EUKA|nr:hypothetical protein SS50377_20339 [Spironucleus salmonicida]|eukprot:EST43020.1 Hypothetical protein SS50377_17323 [Spironucleus salmonicida]
MSQLSTLALRFQHKSQCQLKLPSLGNNSMTSLNLMTPQALLSSRQASFYSHGDIYRSLNSAQINTPKGLTVGLQKPDFISISQINLLQDNSSVLIEESSSDVNILEKVNLRADDQDFVQKLRIVQLQQGLRDNKKQILVLFEKCVNMEAKVITFDDRIQKLNSYLLQKNQLITRQQEIRIQRTRKIIK